MQAFTGNGGIDTWHLAPLIISPHSCVCSTVIFSLLVILVTIFCCMQNDKHQPGGHCKVWDCFRAVYRHYIFIHHYWFCSSEPPDHLLVFQCMYEGAFWCVHMVLCLFLCPCGIKDKLLPINRNAPKWEDKLLSLILKMNLIPDCEAVFLLPSLVEGFNPVAPITTPNSDVTVY